MAQTFIDDSAEDRQPKLLVFAGYVATAAKWKKLTDEWDTCRLLAPPLEYFKMSEAMSFAGQFDRAKGWNTKLRNERVCAFYKIIKSNVDGAISSVLPLNVFKSIIADDQTIPRPMRNRWFFISYNVMHDMLRFGEQLGMTEPIDFVFDKQTRGQKQIFNAWDTFSRYAPINRSLLGSSPRFENDVGLPPLQAADFISWVIRRKAGRVFRREQPETYFWEKNKAPYQRINRVWLPKDLTEFVQRAKQATASLSYHWSFVAVPRKLL